MNIEELGEKVMEVAEDVASLVHDKCIVKNIPTLSIPTILIVSLQASIVIESKNLLKTKGRASFDVFVNAKNKSLNELIRLLNIDLSEIVKQERVKGGGR